MTSIKKVIKVKDRYRRRIFIIILTIIFGYSFAGVKGLVVENLDIPIGVGYDLIGKGTYNTSVAVYEFGSSSETTSKVLSGEGNNLGVTRDQRQTKSNKKSLFGIERIYIIGEGFAESGIRRIIDILLNNPQVSDTSPAVVFKGKAEDLLNYKIKGYANSAEYIEGMLKKSIYYNFFSKQFSMMDLIVRVDAEGRNALLPYIELKERGPEITGLAIFKGDKMIEKTNVQEARIISLLKFNGGRGVLTIQKDQKKYINYYAKSDRKIKCSKKDGKYNFVIDLELNGGIASNELYTDINKDSKELKKFIQTMEYNVKKSCEECINRVKYEYKTDVLDLGRVAAARYGRNTGVDWNKVVSESSIEVNVKVIVKDQGRGDY